MTQHRMPGGAFTCANWAPLSTTDAILSKDATAFHIAATLEEYEERVSHLVAHRREMEPYADVVKEFGRLRSYCASLPQLSVPWVDLLISHSQLLDCLWHMRDQDRDASKLQQRLHRHAASVAVLATRCRTLIARNPS